MPVIKGINSGVYKALREESLHERDRDYPFATTNGMLHNGSSMFGSYNDYWFLDARHYPVFKDDRYIGCFVNGNWTGDCLIPDKIESYTRREVAGMPKLFFAFNR